MIQTDKVYTGGTAEIHQLPVLWQLVGNTPLLPLKRVFAGELPADVTVYGKAEWFNLSGSVKDRPARAIIERAWQSGLLDNGKIFLDSTSGNMGISYATLGAALGLPIELCLPENATAERLAILRTMGVSLTLTDPLEGSEGARVAASRLANDRPDHFHYADQYSNPANWQAHFETTGPEVFEQTDGEVTHFIAGMGTTGTITGVGRFLKSQDPAIQVVGVQPDSPLHGLEGLKHLPSTSTPRIYDAGVPDDIIPIETEEAYEMLRRLARSEGLFVGVSAAAAVLAAYQLARDLTSGVIVVVLPDSGLKYLSQPIWSAA